MQREKMQLKYEKSHPWLSFMLDLRLVDPALWMLIGEVRSKCEHIAGVPMKRSLHQRLNLVYLAKGAHATTAIEGNTLTEEEVKGIVSEEVKLPRSDEYLQKEIENVLKGFNLIISKLTTSSGSRISPRDIMEYNFIVLNELKTREPVIPGQVRHHDVGIDGARYRGAPAENCEYLLNRLCDWLNAGFDSPVPEMAIPMGILKAIVAHLYLAWIHPFGDGNGRTARLVEFQLLLAAGIPLPAAHGLSDHYNRTRQEYYRQLQQASQSGGNIVPFLKYAISGLVDSLRGALDEIRAQQWDIAWRDFVYETFAERKKAGDRRRRQLLLDLSRQTEPTAFEKLRTISPAVAAEYANKAHATLVRDVKELEKMKLIERSQGGIRATREQILQFLPLKIRA